MQLLQISTDGLSLPPLLNDLANAYNALSTDLSPPDEDLQFQYCHWTLWQTALFANGGCTVCGHGSDLEKGLSFWCDILRDGEVPCLDLPRSQLATESDYKSGETLCILESLSELQQLVKRCNATLMQGVLALWVTLLSKHTLQSESVVGIPYSNRDSNQWLSLVGYFVNTLAVVIMTDSTQGIDAVVEAAKQAVVASLRYSSTPFAHIVQNLKRLNREPGRLPLCQSMFDWLGEDWAHTAQTANRFSGLDLVSITGIQPVASEIEFVLPTRIDGQRMQGLIKYNAAMYSSHLVEAMAQRLGALTNELTRQPQGPISGTYRPLA